MEEQAIQESTMDRQLVDEFGLVHYIVKMRLGGYSGVRRAFAQCLCGPPPKSSLANWSRTKTLPAWTILQLCKAAEVDPIEVLQVLEETEFRSRQPVGAEAAELTRYDWEPTPLKTLYVEGVYGALVPDTRGKAAEVASLFEDISLPYPVVAGWKARNMIPAWALLRVCRWAKADPLQVLKYIEDKEVAAKAKQQ
jgi:hypothetical protein